MKKVGNEYVLSESELTTLGIRLQYNDMMKDRQIEIERIDKEQAIDSIGKLRLSSYYAQLPPDVRYDRSLSWFDMILFAEIGSLMDLRGYAFATNKYFSKAFDVSDQLITKSLKKLSDRGYLFIEIDQKKGNIRKLYPLIQTKYKYIPPILQTEDTPHLQNNATRARVKESFKESLQVNINQKEVSKGKYAQIKPDVDIPWLADYLKSQE